MYHQVYLGITHKNVNFKDASGMEHHHQQVVYQLQVQTQVQYILLVKILIRKHLLLTL